MPIKFLTKFANNFSRDILQKITDFDLSNESFPAYTSTLLSINGKGMPFSQQTYFGWKKNV